MYVGGSSSGIRFSGLGSGIDTDSIVTRLLELEEIPIQRLQTRQDELKSKMSLYEALGTQLRSVSTAANSLNFASTYTATKASSSDTEVATVSGGSGAAEGSFDLKVYRLAQAEKLTSTAQTSATDALGLAGKFEVNGKEVEILASDSLTEVAKKVNSAGAGVTASVLNAGAGKAYLSLTSKTTGQSGSMTLENTTGSVLNSLGLAATQIRNTIDDGAASATFQSQSATLKDALGLSEGGERTISLNGTNVTVDLDTDTVATLADKINNAGGAFSAAVVAQEEHGGTYYRLEIVGDVATPTFGGDEDFWLKAGFKKRTSETTQGRDARFTVDGIAAQSATNSVSSVINGATIKLLKANETTPETTTITLERDTSKIKTEVKNFVNAYNAAFAFIDSNSKFDTETFASGALFGDPTAQSFLNQMQSMLFSTVPGLNSEFSNLTQVGLTLGTDGKLALNEAKLDEMLAKDIDKVADLFRAAGSGSTSELKYVSSTNATKSTGGAYDVVISQLATKGSVLGATAQSGPSIAPEVLTFDGAALGSSPYNLTIHSGSTIDDIVDKINADTKLKDVMVATNDGGKLKLESKRFGTAGNFTVVSDQTAATNNSGIGTVGQATTVSGVDIAGTINGEEATGSGQFLTGKTGNATTDGLQIQYTGTATGNVGGMTFTKGIGALTTSLMDTFLKTDTGLVSASNDSLQRQIDDLDDNIGSLTERLELKSVLLREKFAAMDAAIAELNSQAQRMQAMMSGLNSG